MTRYFLGVDIGSTKSHALITTESGEAAGFGTGPAGNHESVGVDGFEKALNEVINAALQSTGLNITQIAGAGFGIAGYDWESDRPLMDRVIGTSGLTTSYEAGNDSIMGLFAGASHGWGVNITSGTSCNAFARDKAGREGRVTGNGAFFGEWGGGGELVHLAFGAISRAWSLRAPQTILSDLFVKHCGAQSVVDLLEGIVRGRYHVRATDAPVVFEAIQQGDSVACGILEFIGRELGNLAVGVIRQAGLENQEFEVVLSGSFFKGSPRTADYIREEVHKVAPGAKLVRLEAPPVVGAALLGMQAGKADFAAVRERLIESTTRFIGSAEQAE
jgi:N-acetylglucosamine kinase-like BadF-type ATPase